VRVPDWLIYAGVAGVLLVASVIGRENADAPSTGSGTRSLAESDSPLLGPVTPFDPGVTIEAPDGFEPSAGTAFSIDEAGRWVTARHVVEGCTKPALIVGAGRAIAASVRLAVKADIAVLLTEGGPPALPLQVQETLRVGARAFHPGYPQGRAGEVSSRLLGRETLHVRGRGSRDEPVLAWAEVGRTRDLEGTLAGLSGAPALDEQGQVIGVTIAESPRRGRIYTTAPETFGPAVRGVFSPAPPFENLVTTENYGRVADRLRRDLRVAQVVCLST
jgi:S1-C subfamily serine protease